jgi:hypothetical protein
MLYLLHGLFVLCAKIYVSLHRKYKKYHEFSIHLNY